MKQIMGYAVLTKRMIRQYTVIILLTLASIAIVISAISSWMLENAQYEAHLQELGQIEQNLSALLKKTEDGTTSLIVSGDFQDIFALGEENAQYQSYLYDTALRSVLLDHINSYPQIGSVSFVDKEGEVFCRMPTMLSRTPFSEDVVARLQEFRRSQPMSAEGNMLWYIGGEDGGSLSLYLMRRAYNSSGQVLGTVVAQLNEEALAEVLPDTTGRRSCFFISEPTRDGCIVSAGELSHLIARYTANAVVGEMVEVDPELYMTQIPFDVAGMVIGALIPAPIIRQNSQALIITVVIAGFLCLLLSAALIRRTTRRQLQPLEEIISVIQKMSEGIYDRRLQVNSGDELEYLAGQINHMADNTQKLMEEIRYNEEQKKQYDYEFLRRQLQPHFLYNVLEMLKGMIEVGEKENAQNTINEIARFYRQTLTFRRDDAAIALVQEQSISMSYLAIMQMRYVDRFSFSFDLAPDTLNCRVPKLILQPLLENAIVHGFIAPHRKAGTLRVAAQRSSDDILCLRVEDNGQGMAAERLAQVRDAMHGQGKHSFGMRSVYERLVLYYGSRADVLIESEPGRGTVITLLLPAQEQEEM